MNGKGSAPRPPLVPDSEIERKWADVYGRPQIDNCAPCGAKLGSLNTWQIAHTGDPIVFVCETCFAVELKRCGCRRCEQSLEAYLKSRPVR